MNDDLERRLRAARPHTRADDGWAASPDGGRTLDSVHAAVSRPRRSGLTTIGRRAGRPVAFGIGLTAAAAVAVTVAVAGSGRSVPPPRAANGPTSAPPGNIDGRRPADVALVAYHDCAAALSALRAHAAAHVNAYGLIGPYPYPVFAQDKALPGRASVDSSVGGSAVPEHSTTNVQEAGVDEPDIVETDGKRVVTVSGGTLRVTDVATHRTTGSLDLTMYSGAEDAQLLMSGDRVLVLLGSGRSTFGGPVIDYAGPYPSQIGAGSGYLLVDVAGGQPRVVSTLHARGGFVDARMVDSTVRLVVRSTPRISFPVATAHESSRHQLQRARAAVRRTPLSAWLPTYDVTTGATTTNHTVACRDVSHPASYTGASMLSVYTFDLAGALGDLAPVSLAADGTTVYASASSLYVASAGTRKTQIHRFDISGPGRPAYLGSGSVPGGLLDSYSLSEYAGSLRAVTTENEYSPSASTSVYVLDAATLRTSGHVGGLGPKEQVHAVRFLGPLAYVVTFESVDPLYVLDLHDPAHPRRAAALQLTGYSDYLHPTSDGRLLGVGEDVDGNAMVTGLQVSLFDVHDSSRPRRLANVVRRHTPGEDTLDPHAFLYWPATATAVVPIQSWNSAQSGAVLVLHVGTDSLRTIGIIRNPAVRADDLGYDQGIERTMVIGGSIWTMSNSGLVVSSASTLARQAWIPFA